MNISARKYLENLHAAGVKGGVKTISWELGGDNRTARMELIEFPDGRRALAYNAGAKFEGDFEGDADCYQVFEYFKTLSERALANV